MNITKQRQAPCYREQSRVYQGERRERRDNIGEGDEEVQLLGIK